MLLRDKPRDWDAGRDYCRQSLCDVESFRSLFSMRYETSKTDYFYFYQLFLLLIRFVTVLLNSKKNLFLNYSNLYK